MVRDKEYRKKELRFKGLLLFLLYMAALVYFALVYRKAASQTILRASMKGSYLSSRSLKSIFSVGAAL